MIVFFTDFGYRGPYTAQMIAAVHDYAPQAVTVDLFNDLPPGNIKAASYLLPAYVREFPEQTVFVCVVDPGVGTERKPVVVRVDRHWFVGPDNGLFHQLIADADLVEAWEILWRPETLSNTFHGRDLFAPVAGMLAQGEAPALQSIDHRSLVNPNWEDQLKEVCYIDQFGNAITGVKAECLCETDRVVCQGTKLKHASTYANAEPGDAFWLENSNGLVEIAVNQGSAEKALGLAIGSKIHITTSYKNI